MDDLRKTRGGPSRPPREHPTARRRGTWPAAAGSNARGSASEQPRGAEQTRSRERMLRRRRGNLLVVGVLALVTLLGIGFSQLIGSGGASSGSGANTQAAAADTNGAPGGTPTSTPSESASPTPSPSASPSHPADVLVVPAADVARCPARIEACVDIKRHLTWLQQGGKVIYGPVSMLPGSKQSPTPTGTYDVQWTDKTHVSGEFGDPMPYSVFFAPGGIAFHQGSQTTSSHGCIHLRRADAAHYFAVLGLRAGVKVF